MAKFIKLNAGLNVEPITITENGVYPVPKGGGLEFGKEYKFKDVIIAEDFQAYLSAIDMASAEANGFVLPNGAVYFIKSSSLSAVMMETDGMFVIEASCGNSGYVYMNDKWHDVADMSPITAPAVVIPADATMPTTIENTAIFFDIETKSLDGWGDITVNVSASGGGGAGEVSAIIKPLTITKNGTYNAVAGGELKYDTEVKFKQTITVEEFEAYIANATPTEILEGETYYALFDAWTVMAIDYGDGNMSYMIGDMNGGPADPIYVTDIGGWVTARNQEPVETPPVVFIPDGSEMSADFVTTAIFFDLSRIDGYAPIVVTDTFEVANLIDPNRQDNMHIYSEKVEAVGNYAFYCMQGVYTVDLPNATSVGKSAFYACHAGKVKLPKVQIFEPTDDDSHEVFATSNLSKIYLRDVQKIRSKLFKYAISVDTVVIAAETIVPLENVDAFHTNGSMFGRRVNDTYDAYIYVPKALVDSYKTATNWSTYANQIRAIEDYPEECNF